MSMNGYRVAKVVSTAASAALALFLFYSATTAEPTSPGYVEPAVAAMIEACQFVLGVGLSFLIIDDAERERRLGVTAGPNVGGNGRTVCNS